MSHTVVLAVWSGTAGLPGYSRFKFEGALTAAEAGAAATRVKGMFQTMAGLIPTAVTITLQPTAQVFSEQGVLEAEFGIPAPTAMGGSAAGTFAAPAGACINWKTGLVFGGRKIKGRTFIVPLASSAYEADGTLVGTARTTVNDAANGLISGTPKPVIAAASGGSGYAAVITTAAVSDRVAVLRSRRG